MVSIYWRDWGYTWQRLTNWPFFFKSGGFWGGADRIKNLAGELKKLRQGSEWYMRKVAANLVKNRQKKYIREEIYLIFTPGLGDRQLYSSQMSTLRMQREKVKGWAEELAVEALRENCPTGSCSNAPTVLNSIKALVSMQANPCRNSEHGDRWIDTHKKIHPWLISDFSPRGKKSRKFYLLSHFHNAL